MTKVQRHLRLLLGAALGLCTHPLYAQQHTHSIQELAGLEIEDLMSLEVTSPGKKVQASRNVPFSLYVITQEQLHRQGLKTIPEALRIVPGAQVALQDANKQSVTIRGFNGRFANKLLVLVDGRSIYTPLFSGTYWDAQAQVTPDLHQIEVIRGPGAAIWGANAFNGVVNILSKNAEYTQGLLFQADAGTQDQRHGYIRHGGRFSQAGYYRTYFQYFHHGDLEKPDGSDNNDRTQAYRGGFRMDLTTDGDTRIKFLGELHRGYARGADMKPLLVSPYSTVRLYETDFQGGYLLTAWEKQLGPEHVIKVEAAYDRNERDTPLISEERDTMDVSFEHRFPFGNHQDLNYGIGFRSTWDSLVGSETLIPGPQSWSDEVLNGFIQDEVTLIKDRLALIVGTKLEDNSLTGFEYQPQARIRYTPNAQATFWAGCSRAVRTPSRAEETFRIWNRTLPPDEDSPGGLPVAVWLEGSEDFKSEELLAHEAGARLALQSVMLNLSVFYNEYENLRSLEMGAPSPGLSLPAHLVIPQYARNGLYAESYGMEASTEVHLTDWLHLRGGYAFFKTAIHRDPWSNDRLGEQDEGTAPRHTATAGFSLNLPWQVELDSQLRFVDSLPALDIDQYIELDARIAWMPTPELEVALIGKNLLDPSHPETGPDVLNEITSEVERSVHAQLMIRL